MARSTRSALASTSHIGEWHVWKRTTRAGVLGALLARGRGLPRLGPGADYLAYDVERASWQMEEAERLYHAERCGLPEALVSRRRKGLTLEDAYRVQWCGAALRVREGARVLGHKVGLTRQPLRPLGPSGAGRPGACPGGVRGPPPHRADKAAWMQERRVVRQPMDSYQGDRTNPRLTQAGAVVPPHSGQWRALLATES